MTTKTEARAEPQPIRTASPNPLLSLVTKLANRIVAAVTDARVTAAGVAPRGEETYIAVRVAAPTGGSDLLGHIRLFASDDPARDVPTIRNSIPTDHLIVAIAKFTSEGGGLCAEISAEDAEACVEQALNAIDGFAKVLDDAPAKANGHVAIGSATGGAADSALTSGATAAEAATAGVKSKTRPPRKSRPASNVSIAKGERK